MRQFITRLALLAFGFSIFSFSFSAGATAADDARFRQLAQNLVTNTLKPKAGDVVIITGGPDNLAAMEYLATDLRKVGAFGIIVYGSNRMQRMYFDQVPSKYDSQYPADTMGLLRIANAMVNFDNPNDPSVTAGVSVSRLNVLGQAGQVAQDTLIKRNIPQIEVGNGMYPSTLTAQQMGITKAQLTRQFWNGLTVDYALLHASATRMATTLRSSHTIHVTAANGTDLTFSAYRRPMSVSDGIISPENRKAGGMALFKFLPGGSVFFIPVRGSANGTVVFGDEFFNGVRVHNLKMLVRNGRMVSWTASSGLDAISKFYAKGGNGRDIFSFADFGVNPNLRYIPNSAMCNPPIGGMVTVGIGNDSGIGGTNRSPFAYGGCVPYATVTVDGTTIAANGKLSEVLTKM